MFKLLDLKSRSLFQSRFDTDDFN